MQIISKDAEKESRIEGNKHGFWLHNLNAYQLPEL